MNQRLLSLQDTRGKRGETSSFSEAEVVSRGRSMGCRLESLKERVQEVTQVGKTSEDTGLLSLDDEEEAAR